MPWTTEADTMTATCTCGETLRCNLLGQRLRDWLLLAKGWRVRGDVLTCPACARMEDLQ